MYTCPYLIKFVGFILISLIIGDDSQNRKTSDYSYYKVGDGEEYLKQIANGESEYLYILKVFFEFRI